MAFFNVEITMGDGTRDTVRVEADNVAEARTKAEAQAETGADIGTPVLEVQPPLTAPAAPAATPAWELLDEGPFGFAAEYGQPPVVTVPPVGTFDDFTQTLDPDLFDPRSTTYVPPVVPPTVIPSVPGTGKPKSLWTTDDWDAFNQIPSPPPVVEIPPPPPAANGAPVSRLETFGEAGAGGIVGGPSGPPGTVMPPTAVIPPTAVVPPTGVVPPTAVVPPPAAAVNGGVAATVINPATGLPILTSRELINDPLGYTTEAGRRLALRNVFGQQALGVGPAAGYLQRQLDPLQHAYRAGAFADMARAFGQDQALALAGAGGTLQGPPQYDYGAMTPGAVGGTGTAALTGLDAAQAALAAQEGGGGAAPATGVTGMPGPSFEDFLRTTAAEPTGLGGAYGQALQNVGYLRGLGPGGVPPALAGMFNPEQASGTWDARNLLGAAQRGKYSGLVSSAFRQPSREDLFADYVLAGQDAAAAGQTPLNFLNFAASRYGL